MDRRKFIKSSLIGATGLAVAPEMVAQDVSAGVIVPGAVSSDGKAGAVSTGVEDHLKVSGYVKEPSHKIPVVANTDVVHVTFLSVAAPPASPRLSALPGAVRACF